ncbi:MAG: TVP38/TMEM64 family protein [Pseudonocardiaceae bacterium]
MRSDQVISRMRVGCYLAAIIAVVLIPFALFGSGVEGWTSGTLSAETSRWLAGVLIFGLLASDILAPIPSSLVCTAAGASLGAGTGTLVAAAGLTCGCLLGFWFARSLGPRSSRRLLGDRELDALTAAFQRYGVVVLVVCRPVPLLAETSVLIAGATSMPLGRVLAVTAAANLGVAGVYSWLGGSAGDAVSFGLVLVTSCALPAAAWGTVRIWRSLTTGQPQ